MGRLQVRMVREPITVPWLSWLTESLPKDSPLWLFSRYRFDRCLREAFDFFNLGHLKLSPASLRAGGAALLIEQGFPWPTFASQGVGLQR